MCQTHWQASKVKGPVLNITCFCSCCWSARTTPIPLCKAPPEAHVCPHQDPLHSNRGNRILRVTVRSRSDSHTNPLTSPEQFNTRKAGCTNLAIYGLAGLQPLKTTNKTISFPVINVLIFVTFGFQRLQLMLARSPQTTGWSVSTTVLT